jgi:hypothetical protein
MPLKRKNALILFTLVGPLRLHDYCNLLKAVKQLESKFLPVFRKVASSPTMRILPFSESFPLWYTPKTVCTVRDFAHIDVTAKAPDESSLDNLYKLSSIYRRFFYSLLRNHLGDVLFGVVFRPRDLGFDSRSTRVF